MEKIVIPKEQRQLEHLEIIVEGDIVRSCAWCEKKHPNYAEDVKVLATGFKRRVSHCICKQHEIEEMQKLENL